MMGGTMAHEFMYLTEIGEDQLVVCDTCGYSANRQVATLRKDAPAPENLLPIEEVETPGTQTIAALAQLLDIPEARTAKATFFMADDRFIFAVVRGDMEVNETKLAKAVGVSELRPARADEVATAGIVAGYASPIGVSGVTVVVDDLVAVSPNLVAGANREGWHLRNTNLSRDYTADIVTDITNAYEGGPCPVCGSPVRMARGVEVGNIFKLGTEYSKGLNATYLDEHGDSHLIVMGSYGIGVGRLLACVAEECRDDRGLIWPVTIAPFHVYLVGLDQDTENVRTAADDVYDLLMQAGVEVLYDDRKERAGVKFNDADLLGFPVRLTISRRTVERGCAELKLRGDTESRDVDLDAVVPGVQEELDRLEVAVLSHLRPEPLETR
jgi:prolyl-tRNA synthetase